MWKKFLFLKSLLDPMTTIGGLVLVCEDDVTYFL